MKKPAETQVPIHDLLRRRWSPRAYNQRPIEIEKLRSLIEAGRTNGDIHHFQFEQTALS
jgi:nitroreductase